MISFAFAGEASYSRDHALQVIQQEVSKGDDMNLLTIHTTLEQVGSDLEENWDKEYFKKIVGFYPAIFKKMEHHGTVESIAPFYRKKKNQIDLIVKKTLSPEDQKKFHSRMKASLKELEEGND